MHWLDLSARYFVSNIGIWLVLSLIYSVATLSIGFSMLFQIVVTIMVICVGAVLPSILGQQKWSIPLCLDVFRLLRQAAILAFSIAIYFFIPFWLFYSGLSGSFQSTVYFLFGNGFVYFNSLTDISTVVQLLSFDVSLSIVVCTSVFSVPFIPGIFSFQLRCSDGVNKDCAVRIEKKTRAMNFFALLQVSVFILIFCLLTGLFLPGLSIVLQLGIICSFYRVIFMDIYQRESIPIVETE